MPIFPLHENDTGSFQELAHASGVVFGQLSLLTIAPRCSRGGHYHTRKREWFCCIHGGCYIVITNTEGRQQRSIELTDTRKEFVAVEPLEGHIGLNPNDRECELLVISSEEYDPEDADTFKIGDRNG